MPSSPEDPLVAQAFDAKKHEDLARAIENLRPEQAAVFLHRLEMAIRKRKIQISGYLAAMLVWVISMMLGLVYYGTHDGFVGWVFFVPFALVGLILWSFGTWAERVAKTPLDPVEARPTEPASPGESADGASLPRAKRG